MALVLSDVTHLLEVRSAAEDWESSFRAELPFPTSDGVIGEPFDGVGLYGVFAAEHIARVLPVVDETPWMSTCPFVGPRRGFFGYWLDPERGEHIRDFHADAARAGRGTAIELGPIGVGTASPRMRASVRFGNLPIMMHRLPCVDVDLALKHNNDALLSREPRYLAHVQQELDRLARKKREGKHGEFEEIEIWLYDDWLR